DNEYGDIEDDVWRRDFTVNALYYDIADYSVVDYTGAMVDIQQRMLRMIGDPETRYREDPVRMLRAIRFAAKLDFTIHPDTEKPIYELGPLLQDIPAARLYEEVLKLFHSGHAVACLELLEKYQLLQYLFPLAAESLARDTGTFQSFLLAALQSTDNRVQQSMPITPAFLFAAMLWRSVQQKAEHYRETMPASLAMQNAMSDAISDQVHVTSIPRRFSTVIRDIWHMQHRFTYRHGQRAKGLLAHPKFRAAYDFYCLRHKAGELEGDGCDWWTRLQTLSQDQQEVLLKPAKNPPRKRSRKKTQKAE
ncbi:MAG: polynucleotide adenylyltransferase PcnB, partial [Gammaproteobacteria bacterium]|nr:polynucleotide adenylyltransferase PcnB [Gammaproteobacteria bacterium]